MISKILTSIRGRNSVFGFIFVAIIACMVLKPVPLFAQSGDLIKEMNTQTGAFAGQQGADLGPTKDPRIIAANIIKVMLGLLGILLVAYIVYGGYLITLSQGNEEQVTKGKEAIKNAVIGLIIILSAYSIVRYAVIFATGDAQKQESYCQVLTDKSGYYNNDPLQQDTVPFTPEQLKNCIKGD